MLRKLLRLLPLILASSLCFGTANVSGKLTNPNPNDTTIWQNAEAHLDLHNCGGNFPIVTGASIAQHQVYALSTTDGTWSGLVYRNDEISCGGVFSTTWWTLTYWANGRQVGPSRDYICSQASCNFDSMTPITTYPPPVPPTPPATGGQSLQCPFPVAASTWVCTHNFGIRPTEVQFRDLNWNLIVPDNDVSTDVNNETATWLQPQAGYMLVLYTGNFQPTQLNPNAIVSNPTADQSTAGDHALAVGGSLSAKRIANRRFADLFSGADFGAMFNNAYGDAGLGDCNVVIRPNPAGGSWQYSTPMTASTLHKPCVFQGLAFAGQPGISGGSSIEYTPTTNTCALTLDYADPAGAGTINGHGVRDLGVWNNHSWVLGGSGSLARGLCYGNVNGTQDAVFENLNIGGFAKGVDGQNSATSWDQKNFSVNTYGNGIGIYHPAPNEGVSYFGGVDIFNGIGQFAAGTQIQNYARHHDTNIVLAYSGHDTTIGYHGDHFENCCTTFLMNVTSASVAANVATYNTTQDPTGWTTNDSVTISGFTGGDTFFNQTCTVTGTSASVAGVGPGSFTCALTHANASSSTTGTATGKTTAHYISHGNGNLQMFGGDMLDDQSSGTEDYAITGTGLQGIFGAAISSAGRQFTNWMVTSGAAFAVWQNASPTVLHPCPAFSTSSICADINLLNPPSLNVPILGLGNQAGVLYLRGAGSGTPPPCPTSWSAGVGGYATSLGCIDVPITTDRLVGRATTDTLTNKTLTSPVINTPTVSSPTITTGVAGDGSGYKHKRISTGSIGATTRTEILLSWGTAFADANYTVSCSVEDSTTAAGTQGLTYERIRTHSASQVGAVINNPTAGGITGTLDCVGVHD